LAIGAFLGASVSLIVLLRGLKRLRRSVAEQQQQIQVLTSRLWSLEQDRTAAVVTSASRPDEASEPAPVQVPPDSRTPDWEAQIGANWLNRAGALILVIGFALLLAFSWTRLGPAGKVAIGGGSASALLLGGVALSRRPLYRSYSVSLIAGGWALLYFTCYATYAVPPARLFAGPAVPIAGMLAVSGGMVLHALRYRSEGATALAFVFAFITLHVPPPDLFTIVAAAVLAAGSLGLSSALRWSRLPIAGAVLTYLTVALRYAPTPSDAAHATVALWLYWVCFETFDVLRPLRPAVASPLFALNLAGLVGTWMLLSTDWSAVEAVIFFGGAAVAYLLSTFVRAWRAPFEEDREPAPYEMAAIASAMLAAAALIQHFSGSRVTLALGLEGELVVLAARALHRVWMRRAGEILLAIACCRLLLFDAFEASAWTPVGFALAAALTANRVLLPNAWPHAAGAAVLLLRVSYAELPTHNAVAATWAVAGVICLVAGQRLQFRDIQWLGIFSGAASFVQSVALIAADGAVWPIIIVAACLYVIQFRWRGDGAALVQPGASVLATLLIAILLAEKVDGGMLTVSFGLQAGLLLAVGFTVSNRILRLSGLGMFVLCVGKLFVHDLRELDAIGRTIAFLALGVLLLGASWIYTKKKSV
jgi:hypothetical protein